MHVRMRDIIILVALATMTSWTDPVQAQFGAKKPKVKVEFLASSRTARPGESLDTAIRFEIQDGWHIYWLNSGDAGMAPRVKWDLPKGVSAGRLQYPIPKRYVDKAGLVTNIHEGEVALLSTLEISPDFDAGRFEARGKLRYLVCKEQCVLMDKDLKLALPVARGGGPAPDNEKFFKAARKALPQGSSKYVSVQPVVAAPSVIQGSSFDLALDVRVAKGHHIQSNKPTMEVFVATDVFLEPTSGVTFGTKSYPKPKIRDVKYIGKVSEFSGRFQIKVPVTVEEPPEDGRYTFSGILQFQACTDGGQCYEPSAVSFTTTTAKPRKTAHDMANEVIRKASKHSFKEGEVFWQPWMPGLPEQLAEDGHIVLVEVRADWCPSCQYIRDTTLDTDAVQAVLDDLCVVTLEADFTHRDESIAKYLESVGRKGPPTMLVYPPGKPNEPMLLPGKIGDRADLVIEHLKTAGASLECTHEDDAAHASAEPAPPAATIPDDEPEETDRSESATSAAPGGPVPPASEEGKTSLLLFLAYAFVGGLILNIMPCVLPVISIKVLSFVQQAAEDPKQIFKLGLVFASGIVLSFIGLAVIILLLNQAGEQVGWGFQFQSPVVVIIMTSIIFAFGLSLFGVFEITLPGGTINSLAAAEQREGLLGAFLKGVLATILATPCTAPFLGLALGAAFNADSSVDLLLIFTVAGIGMAFPYLLLTWQPAWIKFIPKPGQWMTRFKQFMGFVLMGTVIWLLWPLKDLIGASGLVYTLVFLATVAFGVWILGLQTPLTPLGKRLTAWTAATGVIATGWYFSFVVQTPLDEALAQTRELNRCALLASAEIRGPKPTVPGFADIEPDQPLPWRPWAKGLPEQLSADGHTVFVDFTATWCVTCLANKKATLETTEVRTAMRDLCVVPLKADFTARDPEIVEMLQRFGRGGVPLNVIYPAGKPGDPILLPEQLIGRKDLVIAHLEQAGEEGVCPNHAGVLLGSATN